MESMPREQLVSLLKSLNSRLPKATGAQKADLDGLVDAIFGIDFDVTQTSGRLLLYSTYAQILVK